MAKSQTSAFSNAVLKSGAKSFCTTGHSPKCFGSIVGVAEGAGEGLAVLVADGLAVAEGNGVEIAVAAGVVHAVRETTSQPINIFISIRR